MLKVSRGFANQVKVIDWLCLIVRAYVAVSEGFFSMKPVRKFQCNETDASEDFFLEESRIKKGEKNTKSVGNNNICCCQA